MLSTPTLEHRPARPYVAIPATVALADEPAVIPELIAELQSWMLARGFDPAGAPFVRYHLINMPSRLDIDVGLPMTSEVDGDARVVSGELPSGRYAALVHTGPPDGLVDANASLQQWLTEQGLRGQARVTNEGEEWIARTETYLTDPQTQPDTSKHETEIAYLVAD